jgi:hypothetical protein
MAFRCHFSPWTEQNKATDAIGKAVTPASKADDGLKEVPTFPVDDVTGHHPARTGEACRQIVGTTLPRRANGYTIS